MDKKEKDQLWKYGMFGLLAVNIFRYLSAATSTVVVGIALFVFIICIVKNRKGLNNFGFCGYFCILLGMVFGFCIMSGILQGLPLPVSCLGTFTLIGIGTVLIGWGAHLKNPEKVPKKVVYLAAGFWSFILCVWGILFTLRYYNH